MELNQSYLQFLKDLKQNIIQSRYAAARLANKEQLRLYLKTGWILTEKIAAEKWGNSILKKIAADLQTELPGLRGFSDRNLYNMKLFYQAYPDYEDSQSVTAKIEKLVIPQSVTAELQADLELFFSISFTHHILLLNKCKYFDERNFYIRHSATEYWSVAILEHKINEGLFKHQGKLPNNFNDTVSKKLKETALQVFQDEYLWDFMSLDGDENERVIESGIVNNIRKFILGLGKGFSFIGNQYRLEVDWQEFFIDLLFYNRNLQSLVVFELKRGKFKPEYAGQLNFYLNVLDDKVKLTNENPSMV